MLVRGWKLYRLPLAPSQGLPSFAERVYAAKGLRALGTRGVVNIRTIPGTTTDRCKTKSESNPVSNTQVSEDTPLHYPDEVIKLKVKIWATARARRYHTR
ncbi:hypothetical protein PsYK624_049770 [Phanerochaete sordida]|uniref:Uncharacterized protein n=1 Tax=Phanerochaete sordida TaxID=48140 RepID=A0A9P3G7F6_9APHY|nr:hypothetical protein PsYK624_049770 [Phanerochaete sordida]